MRPAGWCQPKGRIGAAPGATEPMGERGKCLYTLKNTSKSRRSAQNTKKSISNSNNEPNFTLHEISGLVIDSDLRRPTQHHLFKAPKTPGLLDCLTGASQASEALVETQYPNLKLLPSGQGQHISLGLLHGKQMASLLDEYRRQFDKILLDSPPLSASAIPASWPAWPTECFSSFSIGATPKQ